MKSKNKHDHKLTKFLKVFIFMLVMLAPFFAIGVKCWYVAKNPNAVQSYTGSYNYLATLSIQEYIDKNQMTLQSYTNNEVTNYYYDSKYFINTYNYKVYSNRIPANNAVAFNVEQVSFENNTYTNCLLILCRDSGNPNYGRIYIYNIIADTTNFYFTKIEQGNPQVFYNGIEVNYTIKYQIFTGTKNYTDISYTTNDSKIYFANNALSQTAFLNDIDFNVFYTDTTLSSVFYSSIQELDKASIFSWTTKTAIYSGLLAMSEGLGVDTPPLAVLLTYWTIITSIYIIIDIILEMFIFLTHWLNDKIC